MGDVGSIQEIQAQLNWLKSLPHKQKIVVAGNHDTYLDPRSRITLSEKHREGILDWGDLHYLQHASVRLSFPERGGRSLSVYGAPQIPACGGKEFAFQYERGIDAWSETVPMGTDVLVTHTPPKYCLDLPAGMGCEWLGEECWKVTPRLHVFGHVHEGRGRRAVWWDEGQRAYERVRERDGGLVWGTVDWRNWLDIGFMVVCGIRGVLWNRLWGGDESGGLRVNAALMNHKTMRIDKRPRIVEI